jgi:class 3 adenylate cyclase/tetratricopeptide (TPR) repeat protein
MTFKEVLAQVIDWLQQDTRVSHRALKRQFALDEDYFEDLKDAILYAYPQVVDDGHGLVWTVDAEMPPAPRHTSPQEELMTPGASLLPAPQNPDAERRQLTVLFCDLVDSTRLASELDPEELREVVQAYQETCAKVIARFEGHIAQYLGDGLLVYFGYPLAHEDDAQRAARAGLGIVEALGQLNMRLEQERGVHLAVRLGIHTGLVVVGDVGGGTRQEQLALGETPNLAARLQGIAAPNTLVISATTFQLLGGFFACQPLGTPFLKGLAQPLAIYRVLYESMARSRLEAVGSTGLTPLVGREQEIGLLLERWAQVKEGGGQVVLLSGEAGIGKSRLVQVLKEQVATEPQAWLTPCQCSPYHQNTALYPMIDLLERVTLRFEQEETLPQKLSKLEGFLVQYGLPMAEAVPLFAALLSLPLPAEYVSLHVSPEQQKQMTLHALLTILLRIAAQQPVLFVMEDLHWVDPSTLEFLSLLVDQGPTTRILALLTFRPDFSPPWTGRTHLTHVTVHRLPQRQVVEVIRQVAHGKSLPAEVVEQIVTKTDGVPLFVEELTKMVLESSLLQEQGERYALTGLLPPLAIPATLQDSLMARLDRLATVKGLAQLGATLGREFSYALLQAVSPWDEATVQQGLHQLVEAEFLYQRGLPPQAAYLFKHALIQDAAYQSLLRSTRQQYHQQIAQVLEAQFPDTVETQPEFLAHHYTAAGLYAQALVFWKRAGERALGRSAYREATVCFEQALRVVQQLPESRATHEQAIDLRFDLRMALMVLGEFRRARDVLHEAATLASTIDDQRRLGWAAGYLTNLFWEMGDQEQAIASGERALEIAAHLNEAALQGIASRYLSRAYQAMGDYRRALDGLRQTASSEHSLFFVVVCLAELGEFAEGIACGEAGIQNAETGGRAWGGRAWNLSMMCAAVGRLYLHKGDLHRAIPLLERSLELCRDAYIPLQFSFTAASLGAAYARSGRATEARPLLEQAVEQAAAMGRMFDYALSVAWLGEAALLAGHLEEAHDCAQRALECSLTYRERGNQAWILLLLGDIYAQRHPADIGPAETSYQQALTLAEALGMRPLQAQCHRGLGVLYGRTGRAQQARVALSTAIELYRAMEMTFWVSQAEAALTHVGAASETSAG